MFENYCNEIGLSKKEATVFKALFMLGTKPASTIAKYLGEERTSIYKILQRLVKENLVFETSVGGIKHFFIPDIGILKRYSEEKIKKYQRLSDSYDNIKSELLEYESQKDTSIPKISIFDSMNGIQNMHKDIFEMILKRNLISLRLFASNIVESQVNLTEEMKQSSLDLFKKLKDYNISIETYLGNGIMLMENISKTFDIDTITKIPASNSAVNIYIVGEVIYIIIFKDSPFGIKIESSDLSNTLHFLFDKIEYKN